MAPGLAVPAEHLYVPQVEIATARQGEPASALQEEACHLGSRSGPSWLLPLLQRGYFEPCEQHRVAAKSAKKVESKFFCTDCASPPLCEFCVAPDGPALKDHLDHNHHHVLQIRRSSLCDGVRIADVGHLLDLTHIQPYIINHRAIVFIHARPQRAETAMAFKCEVCRRQLHERSRFCSLACKLEAMPADQSLSFQAGTPSAARAAASGMRLEGNGGGRRRRTVPQKAGEARAAGAKGGNGGAGLAASRAAMGPKSVQSPRKRSHKRRKVEEWSEPSGSEDGLPPSLEGLSGRSSDASASEELSSPAARRAAGGRRRDMEGQVESAALDLVAMKWGFPCGWQLSLREEGVLPRRLATGDGGLLARFGAGAGQPALPRLVR